MKESSQNTQQHEMTELKVAEPWRKTLQSQEIVSQLASFSEDDIAFSQSRVHYYQEQVVFLQQQISYYQQQVEFTEKQISHHQQQVEFTERQISYYQQQVSNLQQQAQDFHSHMQMLQEQTLQQTLAIYSDVYLRIVKPYMSFMCHRTEFHHPHVISAHFKSACNMISPTLYQPYMLQELPNYIDHIRASYDLDDSEELAFFNEYTALLHQIQDTVSSHEDESAVRQYAVAMYVFFRAICNFTDEEQRPSEEMLEAIHEFRSKQSMTQMLQQQVHQSDTQLLPVEPQQQLTMLQQLEPSYQREISENQQTLSGYQQELLSHLQDVSEYQRESFECQQMVSQYQQQLPECQQELFRYQQTLAECQRELSYRQEQVPQQRVLQQEGDANQDEIPVQCGFAADIENISDHNSIHDEI
ncbi:hypothetical protein Fsol_00584 [Candidatus Fokinia solitaria]|uniref:Uncharacterized protein n=1 Tax=Candidatus Fokinia solitaria TaxID=1802984 RepID=A0A2U8BSQ2_9RICK|nr:hypothetical protein [Candidatus Fokinia solitaria]AWD33371.1 hypothetical protein Fsol_00584 [Candidatus Fokinia solitaria]